MTTELDICNRALALSRSRTRLQVVDDTTEAGYYCGLFYNLLRQTALRAAHWNFARKQGVLLTIDKQVGGSDFNADFSADFGGGTPPFPWLFSFKLPADMLVALWMQEAPTVEVVVPIFPMPTQNFPLNSNYLDFARMQDAQDNYPILVANYPNPYLTYTFDCTDPNIFDPQFDLAFTNALAASLAMVLSGDAGLAKMRLDIANETLMVARIGDGNEGTSVQDHMPDWLQMRGVVVRNAYVPFPAYGPVFTLL